MGLVTIADLQQSPQALEPYLRKAQTLSDMYFKSVAEEQNETYSYKVEHFGTGTRAPGIHASEVSKCMRQIVYCILGTKRQPPVDQADVNMLMRFQVGTSIHSMLQCAFHRIADKSGGRLDFQDEIRIHPGLGGPSAIWNLRSSTDGVFTFMDDFGQPELRVGLEIKTASDNVFGKLRSPQKDHTEQTTIYQAALDLPLMWILYYNKSSSNITQSFAPWLFKFDQNKWSNDLEIRFARCTYMAQSGQLPEASEGVYCRWCSFAYTCNPNVLKRKSKGPMLASVGMRRR